ncbi:MAG TPA: hypothetical protein VFR55_06360, partial [Dehalococcoidia bacterium]|nr:hypothetical protein [Dehalococcoidia bacterium]
MMAMDHQPAAIWFRENWEELRQYNFQWVAATDNGLIMSQDGTPLVREDLGELMSEVAQTGLGDGAVYA